ncbi:ABC transporter substrate-binding protein [Sulfuricurvum sp.]|uniref:ABC transporter substrate-binding protein n=1 Tax=Sulfuricurvum sp. TaxID=2025608 RepID=UPI0026184BE4|nr:ABC transporter substrate-binding protein [Sulfuricurvum sp.]MDD3597989.1 ABC transporter substrate-binding protein [Sulfuricurvum sp.]
MMRILLTKLLLILSIVSTGLLATEKSNKCEKSIKDYSGKDICIPKKMDRIVITCYGGASQEIALFMGANTIVAEPSIDRFQQFINVYPNLRDIKSVGTFNDVNLESLLKLNPDIVFVGVTSIPTNDRIKAMNIPVFTLGIGRHSISSLLEEFLHVGAILHKEQKAKELVKYWQTNMNLIEARVSKIKPADRKRVFYTSGSGGLSSENKQWWGDEFIRASGGINVASELPIKGTVSAEVLSVWNPDIIVISTNKSSNAPMNKLIDNPSFKNLKVHKNKAIYRAPIGTFWWDRPSPESILGFIWLSKILYPEEMDDIDLKIETKKFYKKFYDYSLSDEEYDHFFN